MSAYTGVSDDNTGMPGGTCPYISTKGTVMHIVTPTDESKVKTFVCGRTEAYEN